MTTIDNDAIDRAFGPIGETARPAGLDVSGEPCRCDCHRTPGVRHIIACCEIMPVAGSVAIKLPIMPQHIGKATDMFGAKSKLYSVQQMQEYAREAVRLNTVLNNQSF